VKSEPGCLVVHLHAWKTQEAMQREGG
jgi:hypothetical protein